MTEALTVSQLIEYLQKMPQDLPVYVPWSGDFDYMAVISPPTVVKSCDVSNEDDDDPIFRDICVVGVT